MGTTTNAVGSTTATHLDPFDTVFAPPPSPGMEEPDDAEAQLNSELNDLLEDCRHGRKDLDTDVSFNRAFIAGSQLVGLDEVSQEFLRVVTMRTPEKFPSIDNKLLGIYRAWIGKMMNSLGMVNVRPRNTTYLETRAAEGMSTYLEYIFDKCKLSKKMKKAFGVAAYSPIGYIVPSWDRDAGEKVAFCEKCDYIGDEEEVGQECPSCMRNEILRVDQAITQRKQQHEQLLQQGAMPTDIMAQTDLNAEKIQPGPKLKATSTGDLAVSFYRWHEIYIDHSALEPEDIRYFIIEKPMPVGVIRAKYPEKRDMIHDEGIVASRYLQRYTTGLQYRERRYTNHALYREFHFLPSTMHPDGQVIVQSCDRILDNKPNVYAKLLGRLPCYMFRADVFDDSILGMPWAIQVINLQRERNKLMSQKRALRELTLYPTLIAEDNCGITKRTEMAKPGERLLIRRGTTIQPYYLKTADLPAYVIEEGQQLTDAMQEKAGITPHDLGQSLSADESGRLGALIDAKSDDALKSITIENNCEWIQLNEAILQIGYFFGDAGKEWTVKRGGRSVSMSWNTIGVKPQCGSIYLVEKDILSRNPVLCLSMAERLLAAGYFNDNETGRPNMEKFGQFAGIIDMTGYDTEQADRRYAMQIPEMLKQGIPVMPMPWDRLKVIADELTSWLQSEGRYGDQQQCGQVAQVWLQYAMTYLQQVQASGMPASPDIMNSMPNMGAMKNLAPNNPTAMQPGPGAGAQPTNPGQPPTAAQNVQNADRAGEAAARQTKGQPGTTV